MTTLATLQSNYNDAIKHVTKARTQRDEAIKALTRAQGRLEMAERNERVMMKRLKAKEEESVAPAKAPLSVAVQAAVDRLAKQRAKASRPNN